MGDEGKDRDKDGDKDTRSGSPIVRFLIPMRAKNGEEAHHEPHAQVLSRDRDGIRVV